MALQRRLGADQAQRERLLPVPLGDPEVPVRIFHRVHNAAE